MCRYLPFHANYFPGIRMHKLQDPGMEQEMVRQKMTPKKIILLIVAMGGIANNIMTEMGKMPSDLMHPARMRKHFYQAVSAAAILGGG